jgi:hypothetical protein
MSEKTEIKEKTTKEINNEKLSKQDLSKLDVTKLTPLTKEVFSFLYF